ncbi:MAG: phosphatidylserine decarboxylase [Candidatus Ancillula sp.]|jgi:phosphatidylserine decarboxylase|nr:phosphatidylserine decarboxylase [Candidatus Ancillula sp.]
MHNYTSTSWGIVIVKVFDRKKGVEYQEDQMSSGGLAFLYNTVLGRFICKLLIKRPCSKVAEKYNSSKFSSRKIKAFIQRYNINMREFEKQEYGSFQAFFTRKATNSARKISSIKTDLVSPADSKLLVYQIDENASTNLGLRIKGSFYTIGELVGDNQLAQDFRNGTALVFRLTPDDYHRYIFFDDGQQLMTKEIDGILHTVTPIATSKYKVFSQNYRVVSMFRTKNFKNAIQVEVGALMVGKINNNSLSNSSGEFSRGQEKGYFEFGGSTIILLLQENAAVIDEDIKEFSNKGIEVKVRLGEKIGVKH